MANLGKKWGAVIACWVTALVFVIAGICMGIVIPSFAADPNDGDLAVMFDANGDGKIDEEDENEYHIYHTMQAAVKAVNALGTTADNEATIKLLSNVGNIESDGVDTEKAYFTIDLNGFVWCMGGQLSINGGRVTITDTCEEEVVHYLTAKLIDGFDVPVDVHTYEWTDEPEEDGNYTPVKGGIVLGSTDMWTLALTGGNQRTGHDTWEDYGDAELVLDKGTFIGELSGIWMAEQTSLTINDGVNLQFYTPTEFMGGAEYGLPKARIAIVDMAGDATIYINGGNIYGEIMYADVSAEAYHIFNLATDKADRIKIAEGIKMKKVLDKEGNFLYYAAVDADSVDETPNTTPNDPIAESEADDNNNMIALIVLGAAAAVMVVGVAVIIMVNAKRRKKVA